MQPLNYARPTTVDEAVALLATDGARVLAGGTDLVPQLRERRREARLLVDLKHVPELTSVSRTADGGWRIGAATSVRTLYTHGELIRDLPGLIQAAGLIGSLQIQARATLGGNLCNAAPSADAVPVLLSLDAIAEVSGPGGRRTAPAADIPVAPGKTSLDRGEMVTAVVIAPQGARTAARYLRFTPRREMDIAIAGAGARLTLADDGRIAAAHIVLASVAPVPLRAPHAEASLTGAAPTSDAFAEAGRLAASEASPISDTRASAEYRRDLVATLTRRVLEACTAEINAKAARP